MNSWYRHGLMVLTKTHGIDIDSWYSQGLMVLTQTHGIDLDLLFRHGLMVQTWTYGIGKDSWYGHRLMVLTTLMVLTYTHGIVLVLLNHTHTKGPKGARLRDFFLSIFSFLFLVILSYIFFSPVSQCYPYHFLLFGILSSIPYMP